MDYMDMIRDAAEKAYGKLMAEVFKGCRNPTYQLSELTIDHIVGAWNRVNLSKLGYIKRVGFFNDVAVYQVRFN